MGRGSRAPARATRGRRAARSLGSARSGRLCAPHRVRKRGESLACENTGPAEGDRDTHGARSGPRPRSPAGPLGDLAALAGRRRFGSFARALRDRPDRPLLGGEVASIQRDRPGRFGADVYPRHFCFQRARRGVGAGSASDENGCESSFEGGPRQDQRGFGRAAHAQGTGSHGSCVVTRPADRGRTHDSQPVDAAARRSGFRPAQRFDHVRPIAADEVCPAGSAARVLRPTASACASVAWS